MATTNGSAMTWLACVVRSDRPLRPASDVERMASEAGIEAERIVEAVDVDWDHRARVDGPVNGGMG
jgi:hypothetical protein